jgi:hypothetical protein
MARVRLLLALGLLLGLAAPIPAADQIADGTYKLSYSTSSALELNDWLIKIGTKDGQKVGSLAAASPRLAGTTVENVTVKGSHILVTVKLPTAVLTFEGQVSAKDAKQILGSLGDDRRLYRARMTLSDLTELKPADTITRLTVPESMQQAQRLASRGLLLRAQAQQATDADEKAELLKQAAAAEKEAQAAVPKLYREVVDKHADHPAVLDAGGNLLRQASRSKESAEQVGRWAEAMARVAEPYGPRMEQDIHLRIAEVLAPQDAYAAVALKHARLAAKGLSAQAAAARQVRVLKPLEAVQRKAGLTAEAQQTAARLARLEEVLDKEYLAKVPPFKPQVFAGRKGKSDRAVVMELFTGSECPPCVAADVAFDALLKTYKPSELVLIQYHVHIPGPDPLTNADTEARFDYYRKEFPGEIRGAPSTVFNGKPQAGGGGPMARAEPKFDQYRQIIDPLLEEPAGARLSVTAVKQGHQIEIKAAVADLAAPGANKKLRLLLVEDTIRFAGGNGVRFHHHVVRALPGGVDGFALTEKASKHTTTVNLDDLRKQLNNYLDDYASTRRPFPHADRPLDLRNLRVIAFVQDDQTKEIVQGTLVEVAGQSAQN